MCTRSELPVHCSPVNYCAVAAADVAAFIMLSLSCSSVFVSGLPCHLCKGCQFCCRCHCCFWSALSAPAARLPSYCPSSQRRPMVDLCRQHWFSAWGVGDAAPCFLDNVLLLPFLLALLLLHVHLFPGHVVVFTFCLAVPFVQGAPFPFKNRN